MLEALNISNSIITNPIGQHLEMFDVTESAETIDFRVPLGVYSISVVLVGGGGMSSFTGSYPNRIFTNGGGGGLSWRNHIPVTPGEILTIVPYVDNLLHTDLRRGSEILARVQSGRLAMGGLGGKNVHSINDGGGNGGNGGRNLGGGGAGGYLGNGGNGTNTSPGQNGTGGGGGGGCRAQNAVGTPQDYFGAGGGVDLYGLGNDGLGGVYPNAGINFNPWNGQRGSSRQQPAPRSGGLGRGQAVTNPTPPRGGIRIIWGEDRYFPNTNTDDIII